MRHKLGLGVLVVTLSAALLAGFAGHAGAGAVSTSFVHRHSLALGSNHACATTATHTVKCWGYNGRGELGNGFRGTSRVPVRVARAKGIVSLAASDLHSCALTSAGALMCWGRGQDGELGTGSYADHPRPAGVRGLGSGVTAVASGDAHTCAIISGGAVRCWGDNAQAQVDAEGTRSKLPGERKPNPTAVSGLGGGIKDIAAGQYFNCAVTATGGVKCWGDPQQGELGIGTISPRAQSRPYDVAGLASGVVSVAAGWWHACALLASGAVKCWGENIFGDVGDGTKQNERLAPVAVAGLGSGVVQVVGGGEHTCALTSAGAVKCWGQNSDGQLGDGTRTQRDTPVNVRGLSTGVVEIAAGDYFSCARLRSGAVKCWGENQVGQLGTGKTAGSSLVPVSVVGLNRKR